MTEKPSKYNDIDPACFIANVPFNMVSIGGLDRNDLRQGACRTHEGAVDHEREHSCWGIYAETPERAIEIYDSVCSGGRTISSYTL